MNLHLKSDFVCGGWASLVACCFVILLAISTPSPATGTIGSGFADNGDGTVTQKEGRLMWQKNADGVMRTMNDAANYCKALSLAKYRDWHLPDEQELLFSLWADAQGNGARELFFPDSESDVGLWYDTHSSGVFGYLDWPKTGTVANEVTGYARGEAVNMKRYVICVRFAG